MYMNGNGKKAGKRGGGGDKLKDAEDDEGTPAGAKNRKNKKDVRKLTCVNGGPGRGDDDKDAEKRASGTPHPASDTADGTQKQRKRKKKKEMEEAEKEMQEGEPGNMNNRPTPAQGEGIEEEVTAASMEGRVEVTAAGNGEPKRKKKSKKADQAGGSLQDIAEEEGCLAKKIKTESMKEKTEQKKEVPAAEVSLENNEPGQTRHQMKKWEWMQKKIMENIMKRREKREMKALAMAAQGQNTSTTSIEEPQTDNKDKGKKRKLNDVNNPLVSVGDNKQGNSMENDDVPTKKMKQESAKGSYDSQKEAATGPDKEAPAKKRKRKRKKKPQDRITIQPETTTPKEKKKRRRKRKRRRRQPTDNKKQEGIETLLPNTSGSKPSDPAPIDSTQDGGMQMPILHPSCTSEENKKRIAECWKGGCKEGLVLEEGSIEVIKDPFSCCYIPHLLQDETYLDGVRRELDNIKLHTKNNDLYKFRQTGDLQRVTSPFIARLRHLLCTDIRQWLIDVTGIPLRDLMDMGSSRYSHTDVLLCHDDELEGRRIAYILYLVPPWGPEDGGSLDLFAADGDGYPSDIVRSLIPKNNAFAFFEVSPVSFHQVSEVLSCDKTRLSINGWFHGPPLPIPKRNPPPLSPLQRPTYLEEEDFYTWINPMYLNMNIQKEIRQKFCSESELELENFLTDEAYERLSGALRSEGLAWQRTGPADRQCYEILGPDSMPQDAKECRQFLSCEALFLVLSQLTGLKLHPWAPQDSDDDDDDEEEETSAEPNPRCHVEAQRWGPGCYTLIRDDCVDSRAALDAFLYANVSQQWTQQLGGHITYIAMHEDEELLTVVPQSNCLCLVYRDAQTLRFTKYITSAARNLGTDNSHFHNFACTYYE